MPVALRWQGTIRAEAGRPGSWIEHYLEARFNIQFEPSFIVAFSYPRVLPIRLLGGDVPDVTWIFARDMQRFARHGFALELPAEVIRRHAPSYVRLLNAHAPESWLLSRAAGRNFGLPLFTVESAHPRTGMWRVDWLRKVGIERAPDTLAEMQDALWRFRHRDPDGNGRKDTYGMGPWKPPIAPETIDRSFDEIFAAHGVLTTGWMIRGGKVAWGGILPETRQALALLQQWYADGLIYPDYTVMPAGSIEMIKKFTGGLVGYLAGLGDYTVFDRNFPPSIAAIMSSVQGADIVPASFPTGPTGAAGGRGVVAPEQLSVLMFGRHLAHQPEKVVRVLRMLDAMAADENLFLAARLGQRGHHWQWNEKRGLHALPPFEGRFHASRQLLHWIPEPWQNWGYYVPFGSSRELANRFKIPAHRTFDEVWRSPRLALHDAIGHAAAVPSADKYLGDLVQMQVTVFSEIITGRRPLSHFEVFVRDWFDSGGRLLTSEANDFFVRKDEILRQSGVTAGADRQGAVAP